jgi:hypothetical protein
MATTNLAAGERGAYGITLSANTVDTVDLDGSAPRVRITTDGTDEVYVTIDGTTPTVGGKKTHEIPAAASTVGLVIHGPAEQVKLISAAAVKYSVTAL